MDVTYDFELCKPAFLPYAQMIRYRQVQPGLKAHQENHTELERHGIPEQALANITLEVQEKLWVDVERLHARGMESNRQRCLTPDCRSLLGEKTQYSFGLSTNEGRLHTVNGETHRPVKPV